MQPYRLKNLLYRRLVRPGARLSIFLPILMFGGVLLIPVAIAAAAFVIAIFVPFTVVAIALSFRFYRSETPQLSSLFERN